MTDWKLVRTELTPEMKSAGMDRLADAVEMMWDAMLEVSPASPEPIPIYQRSLGEDIWQDCSKEQAETPIIGNVSRTLFTYPFPPKGLARAADELDRLLFYVGKIQFAGWEQEKRFYELRTILRSELNILRAKEK